MALASRHLPKMGPFERDASPPSAETMEVPPARSMLMACVQWTEQDLDNTLPFLVRSIKPFFEYRVPRESLPHQAAASPPARGLPEVDPSGRPRYYRASDQHPACPQSLYPDPGWTG